MKDVVQYNLFPSADMILSLSKECGTEYWEPTVHIDVKVDIPCQHVRMKRHAPIDTHNKQYVKQLRSKPCKDFIQVGRLSVFWVKYHLFSRFTIYIISSFFQDNIRTVKEESESLQKPKAAVFSLDQSVAEPKHLYSTHTFNSREQVKELLRKHLAQVC